MPVTRKSITVAAKRRTKRKPRNSYRPKTGRPTAFNPMTGQELCARMAEGMSLTQACDDLNIERRSVYRWMFAEPSFRHDVLRARELRGDLSFGEQILDIADDAENDWTTAQNGHPIVNKEIVLR